MTPRKPTPKLLNAAAAKADRAEMERLLKAGADPNACYRNYSPLHVLMEERPHGEPADPSKEKLRCADLLCKYGANMEVLGGWPAVRPMLTAAKLGSTVWLEWLRAKGACEDFYTLCSQGELARVRTQLGKQRELAASRDSSGLTALASCALSRFGVSDARIQKSLRTIAELLLDAGADPRAQIRSWSHDVDATYFAIHAKQRAVAELLMVRGADLESALTSAAWASDFDSAAFALGLGASIERAVSASRPLLLDLIRWGQFEAARWLLDRGADPNVTDSEGWTAVHQAASRGNEAMLRDVLVHGGDPRRRDKKGITPWDLAHNRGRAKLVALLTP